MRIKLKCQHGNIGNIPDLYISSVKNILLNFPWFDFNFYIGEEKENDMQKAAQGKAEKDVRESIDYYVEYCKNKDWIFAFVDNKPAGFLVYEKGNMERQNPQMRYPNITVLGVFVVPKYMRNGIAYSLYCELEEIAGDDHSITCWDKATNKAHKNLLKMMRFVKLPKVGARSSGCFYQCYYHAPGLVA